MLLALVLLGTASFPVFAAAGDDAQERIDSAELNPVAPQSDALDDLLDDLLDEIVDPEHQPYEQLQDCYDYLVETVSYGSHTRNLGTLVGDGVSCRQIYNSYGEVEGFGAVALTAKVGMCNAYASAFILLARKIGLEAQLVRGSTRSAGGGYAYHEWAEITVDGVTYLFDPQLEQDLVQAGLPAYSVFCKTYEQVPGRYIKQ